MKCKECENDITGLWHFNENCWGCVSKWKEPPKKPVDKVARLVGLGCLLVIVILLVYTVYNVQTLTTSPCELCENLGRYCVQDYNWL